MKEARRFGPVFKTMISGALVTCVTEHRRSRNLLKKEEERLGPPESPYSALVPGGFLRTLTGDAHRRIRRIFVRAVRPVLIEANERELRALTLDALADLAAQGAAASATDLVAALDRITTGMLLVVFLGVRRDDLAFTSLARQYAMLGPREFVWHPQDAQRTANADLVAAVRALIRSAPDNQRSVLREILQYEGEAALDDAVVGNLVYMIEMGRYDLRSLFRWIVKYLSDSPSVVAALRAEAGSPKAQDRLAVATVMEVLRLDQSEAIVRRAIADIEFDGVTIPKGSFVRACMREAHRESSSYANPDRFEPSRFLGRDYGADEYSPFGLDHHTCLASEIVLRLGVLFIATLVWEFDWQVSEDGPRHRGFYHWEPAANFAVNLTPICRTAAKC
jgi:cytochrome P450